MKRLVAGGLVVGALLIVATGLHLTRTAAGRADLSDSADSGRTPSASTASTAVASAEGGRRDVGGSKESVLFQQIVHAQEKALAEALAKFPVRNVRALPTAPILGLDKARGKRIRMADARFGQMLEKIALAHGMTRGEVEAIYRRGQAESWRPTP